MLAYALYASLAVQIKEKVLLNSQQEAKNEKKQILLQKKMLACQKEYGDKLTYIAMAHSLAFWKTKPIPNREYNKLESRMAKLNAVRDQIQIHVIGFRWKDIHHPWSKEGHVYSSDDLFQYLVNKIIPPPTVRGIPDSPTMN